MESEDVLCTSRASAGGLRAPGVVPRDELLRQAADIDAAMTPPPRRELGSLTAARRRRVMAMPPALPRSGHSAINLVVAFYAPLAEARAGLRHGEPRAIAQALEFLEADPWCFRSGYMKADLMRAFAKAPEFDADVVVRLQNVVVHRLREPQPRLFWPTARLAERVWDAGLAGRAADLAVMGPPAASQAERLLAEMALRKAPRR